MVALALSVLAGVSAASAGPDESAATTSILKDLGFSLTESNADKTTSPGTKKGVLVPTPWGEVEATIVSTPIDRMVRVPLTSGSDTSPQVIQPYVTAGSRKNVDSDP